METGDPMEVLHRAAKSVEPEPKHVHEVATIQHRKIQELHVLVQALTHRTAILKVVQVGGVTDFMTTLYPKISFIQTTYNLLKCSAHLPQKTT